MAASFQRRDSDSGGIGHEMIEAEIRVMNSYKPRNADDQRMPPEVRRGGGDNEYILKVI